MIDTEALCKKVVDLAIQGKLTQQLPEDGSAEDLYTQIQEKKEALIKSGKIKKQKSLPKISDSEIPFKLPENWKWIRLNDLGVFGGGKTPSMNNSDYWRDGKIPWITSKDMKQKYLSTSQMLISECALETMTVYPPKSVLFVVRSGILKRMLPVAISLESTTINQDLKALCLYIPEMCEFVYCVLKGLESLILFKYAKEGTTVNNINFDNLLSMPIPLPPLREQNRIVELIDEVVTQTDVINILQQQYESDREVLKGKIIDTGIRGRLTEQLPGDGNADDLYAQIQEEKVKLIKEGKIKKEKPLPDISDDEIPFDIPENWKWVRLGNLGANVPNAFADGPFGSNLKREHYTSEKQVRIIQLSNVGIEGWKDDNRKYTTYEHLKSIQRSEVKAGDIVIAKMMPAGRSIVVPDISNAYVLSSDCVKFVPNSLLDTNYLRYAINSNIFHDQVLQDVHGIGRERTSLSNLKRYLLPIPPIEEQKRIVSIIEAMFIQLAK